MNLVHVEFGDDVQRFKTANLGDGDNKLQQTTRLTECLGNYEAWNNLL